MKEHILIVEDDEAIVRLLRRGLTFEGYQVETALDGETGLAMAREHHPDLVILDLMLPGIDGLEVCQRLRGSSNVPILMLTAKDTIQDRVSGLDAGADDYLVKPFELDEVLARVRALLRRAAGRATPSLAIGPVVLDTRQMRVTVAGAPVALSPLEYRCLSYLMHHAGRVVPPTELMEHLYDHDHDRDPNAVEVLMGRLRRKLGVDLIETRRGFGYLVPEEQSTA